jgi:hypothetical protein
MSILDLKSNLSNFRKPTTVKEQEKQKLKESPIIKTVYSTSNTLKNTSDIKINKVDNSTSIQVLGAKKIDYKLFSINTSRGRGIPSISTLFGKAVLDKESLFKKFTPGNIVKVSGYKEQRPVNIPKESNFVKITPIGIQHISTFNAILTILKNKVSLYKEQFPRALPKISEYIDQSPRALLKLSLYIDQIPRPLSKLSLYIDQLPRPLLKLSLYKDQRPNIVDKLSLYKKLAANGFDDLQSGARGFTLYQTATQYLGLDTSALEYIYPKTVKFGRLNDRLSFTGEGLSGFDDLQSGAIGFTEYQAVTQYLGVNTIAGTYTYPNTVKLGRLKDKTKIKGAEQWPSKVSFGSAPYSTVPSNNPLYNTTYDRTTYSITKPYLTSTGITGDDLRTYFTRINSPSARDKIYTAFNLRTASYNPFSFGPAFNQPLILRGIQREKDGELARGPQSWGFENNFDDGLIRGGIVGSTERAIFDVLRIGKWIASPRGLLFIVKQAGLQASAPNTEADPFVGKRAGNGALTLISSLANTATQHLGIRFRKDAVPFIPRTTYSSVMLAKQIAETESPTLTQNRLRKLYENLILGTGTYSLSDPTGILGGPQSVYGIGTTPIKRTVNSVDNLSYRTRAKTEITVVSNDFNSDDTKYVNNPYIRFPSITDFVPNNMNSGPGNRYVLRIQRPQKSYFDSIKSSDNYYTLGYGELLTRKREIDKDYTKITNFLLNDDAKKVKWIPTQGKFNGSTIQDYTVSSQHKRKKLQVPDYGKRGKNLRNPLDGAFMNKYTPAGPGMADPIWKINQTDEEAVDDFIKFMFHDLNTNERFRFRAYIENVSEDFSPEWQEVKILGRADSPYIYQGFSRTVQISFKVAALSRADLMLMWDQLERLAKTTVPKYNSTYKMKGPLIKFTLGNWFINTPAFIKSLSYTVDNDTPWEINLSDSGIYLGDNKEYNVGELPMTVSVQVSMQIFGEVRPASTHTQPTPDGITESTHYGAGHLYPLGVDKLRTKRQTALMGNSNLVDPEDDALIPVEIPPKPPALLPVNIEGPAAPTPPGVPILSRKPPTATAPAPAAAKETMEQKMLREKYDLIENAPENSKSIQIIHYK